MTTKVWLSTRGEPVDPAEATISVFDRGFLYGDSVYETMRTAGGRPLELVRHLARLRGSAAGIGMEVPYGDAQIEQAIADTHRAAGNPESYVRVIVTRGAGPIMLDTRLSGTPTLVILVQPLVLPPADQYERGISACVVDMVKSTGSGLPPSIKSGNYLANILALREAIARGADDAIMRGEDGDVSEAATSNVFVVQDGTPYTPPLSAGLLAGITRQVVRELAEAEGHPVQMQRLSVETLHAADEVFLTSSVRGIMPVTRLDDRPVGDGRVGPVTRTLRLAYDRWVARSAGTP